ncbi:hypothetical protein BH23CHL5_BH23CHL5_10910 [soil metagenome]
MNRSGVESIDENEQDHSEPELTSNENVPSSRQRTIVAALLTIAVVAILALAINSGDNDNNAEEPPPAGETVPTVSESVDLGGEGDEELGSLQVTGYLCPSASAAEAACTDGGAVEVAGASLRLEDGRVFTLEDVDRQPDGSYAWLNIPIGSYVLLAEGLEGPDLTVVRDVGGSTGVIAEGWQIGNKDPNQPAIVQIFFVPDLGEGEAAG